jgi:hypothetical protein
MMTQSFFGKVRLFSAVGLALAALCAVPAGAIAQNASDTPAAMPDRAMPPPAEKSSADLAKQLSNPVASLISVPLQQNFDFGAGVNGRQAKSTLNIQPVIPLSVGPNWNVIVRTIVPVVTQGEVQGPGSSAFGLGDITQSFFFSPKHAGPSGIIWGIGPAILYPAATSHYTGSDKWGAGPTVVLVKQSGKSTFGLLANHIWSFAGNDHRSDISATFIQPFFSYTTARATTYGLNTETTYDWKSKTWVVPINVTVSQLTRIGKQPVSFGLGGRYYAESPTGGPAWGMRFILTLLFPKK